MIDPPDRPEEPHEGRRRADGGEKGEAVLRAGLHVVDRALNRHGDPGVDVDAALQSDVLAGRLEPRFGDEPIGAAFLQTRGALAHRRRGPERFFRGARLRAHLGLFIYLGADDVPASHRHDDQDPQSNPQDNVAAFPHRFEAVGILDDFGHPCAACRRRRRRGSRRGFGGRSRCCCRRGLGLSLCRLRDDR